MNEHKLHLPGEAANADNGHFQMRLVPWRNSFPYKSKIYLNGYLCYIAMFQQSINMFEIRDKWSHPEATCKLIRGEHFISLSDGTLVAQVYSTHPFEARMHCRITDLTFFLNPSLDVQQLTPTDVRIKFFKSKKFSVRNVLLAEGTMAELSIIDPVVLAAMMHLMYLTREWSSSA